MSSLAWSWDDLWNWWGQVEVDQKRFMWKELTGDIWMKNLTPQLQFEVLKSAPMEVLEQLKKFPDIFKMETLERLDAHVRGVPYKPKRRYRR